MRHAATSAGGEPKLLSATVTYLTIQAIAELGAASGLSTLTVTFCVDE